MCTQPHSGTITGFIRIGHADLRRPRRIEAGESRGRDADDRHRIVVDEDLLADDRRDRARSG